MSKIPVSALSWAVSCALAASSAQAAPARSFFEGAAGTLPSNPKDRAQTYFDMPQVETLLEDMEKGPVSSDRVTERLKGSDATIADLVRTKLIKATPAGYVIAFNYFTLADVRKIHATADKYVPSLVAEYRAHAPEIERILNGYPVKSVPRKRLAAVLLSGFALNWDGLDATARFRYRRPQLVTGPGWRYSFFASEEDPSYSQHGFIWGSSSLFGLHDNFEHDPVNFEFSSFGDPYSDPRMNLPDLFVMPLSDMSADVAAAVSELGTRDEAYFGSPFKAVLGPSRARSIGPMLFALRKGPQSRAALSAFVEPSERGRTSSFIKLLVATEYIRERADGRFELIAPVLDEADRPMIDRLLALHRRILLDWLRKTYPRARAELSTITAVRQGVPFESTFTQIWHEYFGLATRELVAEGMIEDPYSKERKHPGSVAVLWRRALYHFDPG